MQQQLLRPGACLLSGQIAHQQSPMVRLTSQTGLVHWSSILFYAILHAGAYQKVAEGVVGLGCTTLAISVPLDSMQTFASAQGLRRRQ